MYNFIRKGLQAASSFEVHRQKREAELNSLNSSLQFQWLTHKTYVVRTPNGAQ